jgi:Oxidoreductase family, NAD-binding Rossmann fold
LQALRIGLLSTARINSKLVAGARSSSRVRVVAIASRELSRAETQGRELGVDTAYGSYEELLADPAVDAIYVSLPGGCTTLDDACDLGGQLSRASTRRDSAAQMRSARPAPLTPSCAPRLSISVSRSAERSGALSRRTPATIPLPSIVRRTRRAAVPSARADGWSQP